MTKYVRERQTLLGLNSSFVGVASMPEIYVINRMHHARHGTPWRRHCDRSHGTRLETFKAARYQRHVDILLSNAERDARRGYGALSHRQRHNLNMAGVY